MTVDTLVISDLAAENAELREHLGAWRACALVTLDLLHTVIDGRAQLVQLATERLPNDVALVEALTTATSYREMTRQAIAYASTVTQQHDRLRAAHYRLIEAQRARRIEAA